MRVMQGQEVRRMEAGMLGVDGILATPTSSFSLLRPSPDQQHSQVIVHPNTTIHHNPPAT